MVKQSLKFTCQLEAGGTLPLHGLESNVNPAAGFSEPTESLIADPGISRWSVRMLISMW